MEEECKARQADEIEALSAIYGDEWCFIDGQSRKFCIRIADQKANAMWTVNLQIHLPEDYPLQSPPMFQINAPWLRGMERSNLEHRLSEIYFENLGEDLIYLWAEAIREHLQNKTGNGPEERSAEDSTEVTGQSIEVDDVDDNFDVARLKEEVTPSLHDKDVARLKEEVTPSLHDKDTKSGKEYECPKIFHGDSVTDRKSTFQPHLAPIFCKQQIDLVLDKLKENKKIANATHNIVAYRIVQNDDDRQRIFQGCDDDGESQAGSRMLHLLQLMNAENVMVVVTRWFGGIQLGPDRFRHINNCTRMILEQHGYLTQKDKKGPRSGKKGK